MDNTNSIDKLNTLIKQEGIKNTEIEKIILELKLTLEAYDDISDAENLIYVPMNPLIKEAKDLGGAEAVAFLYNVLGTAAVSSFTKNTAALSLAGPIIEKVGFVLRERFKAIAEYKKTGKPISEGFKNNLSNGLKNLLIDIGVHDTIYTALMAYGINNNIFDARVLAIFSFLIALPPAIFVKYSGNELLYHLQKNYTKLFNFEWEKYYEARFIMDEHPNPRRVFEQTIQKFGLPNFNKSSYHDQYFDHRIPTFSDRTGTVKHREILDQATGKTVTNLEIAHMLATKDVLNNSSIYNFFYSSKEKGKKDLSTKNLEEILKKHPYNVIIKDPSKEVFFEREAFYDNEMRVTFDTITKSTNNQLQKVMEIKVYNDTKYLMEVMKFIMSKGKIKLTTQGKKDFA